MEKILTCKKLNFNSFFVDISFNFSLKNIFNLKFINCLRK